LFTKNASRIAGQNAGEGPGILRGLSEVPGSGKFKLLLELLGFKKPGPSCSPLAM